MNKIKKKIFDLCKDKKFIIGFVLIVVAFAVFIFNEQEPDTYTHYGDVIYLKNNNIYTADIATGEKGLVTSCGKLQKESYNKVYNAVYSAEDKSGMIVAADINNTKNGHTLYYISKKDGNLFIDDSIKTYSVSKNIDVIAYIKGQENELYLLSNGEKELIAKNAAVIYISENGESLSYYTYDKEIFVKESGKEASLIAKNAILEYFGENLIYYIEDGSLYKYSKEKELIDENVYSLKAIGTNGDLLYIVPRTEVFTVEDIILDGEHIAKGSEAYDYWKDIKAEKTYYSLIYKDKGEKVLVTDKYRLDTALKTRQIGDHIREIKDKLSFNYQLDKSFEGGIYIYGKKDAEFVEKKLDADYGGEGKFISNYAESNTYPYTQGSSKVFKEENKEYYLYRPSNGYLNLYYKENGEEIFVDSLVGYVSLSRSGDIWYLKGRSGDNFELYYCSGTDKNKITSDIKQISGISSLRTREFYKFMENEERVSEIITDKEEQIINTEFANPHSGGGFCGTTD